MDAKQFEGILNKNLPAQYCFGAEDLQRNDDDFVQMNFEIKSNLKKEAEPELLVE